MKTIFLDIDGVLNSYSFYYRSPRLLLKKCFPNATKSNKVLGKAESKMISKWRLFLLGKLVKKYNCNVVLSSSWRSLWGDNMAPSEYGFYTDKLFRKYGVTLTGKTPNGPINIKKKYEFDESLIDGFNDTMKKYLRGTQILDYIEENKLNIKNCLILEDDYFDVCCYKVLDEITVRTKFYGKIGGLNISKYFEAKKLLGK